MQVRRRWNVSNGGNTWTKKEGCLVLRFWLLKVCANEGFLLVVNGTKLWWGFLLVVCKYMNQTGARKLTLHEIFYIISNVYWAPRLKNNLSSVRQLQEKVVALFKDGVAFMIHKKEKWQSIMTATWLNHLQLTNEERCFQVPNIDQWASWHYHYDHLCIKGLCNLKHKNIVKDLVHADPCSI